MHEAARAHQQRLGPQGAEHGHGQGDHHDGGQDRQEPGPSPQDTVEGQRRAAARTTATAPAIAHG